MMSVSLPNQLVMHCITFIDFFSQRMNIPLDWCMNEEVMCPVSYLYTHNSVSFIALPDLPYISLVLLCSTPAP